MDENKFDLFKATDRERINEALRMMDEWEKEEKEAADWDDEVDESDQYANLPEHTRKLLDYLGTIQGTLNTFEVKDDREKLDKVLKIVREKGSDPQNYSPSLLLVDIREILEE